MGGLKQNCEKGPDIKAAITDESEILTKKEHI
jgi:hypothetical protein